MRPMKKHLRTLESTTCDIADTKMCLKKIGERIGICLGEYKNEDDRRKWKSFLWEFVSKFTNADGKKLAKIYHNLKKDKSSDKSKEKSHHKRSKEDKGAERKDGVKNSHNNSNSSQKRSEPSDSKKSKDEPVSKRPYNGPVSRDGYSKDSRSDKGFGGQRQGYSSGYRGSSKDVRDNRVSNDHHSPGDRWPHNSPASSQSRERYNSGGGDYRRDHDDRGSSSSSWHNSGYNRGRPEVWDRSRGGPPADSYNRQGGGPLDKRGYYNPAGMHRGHHQHPLGPPPPMPYIQAISTGGAIPMIRPPIPTPMPPGMMVPPFVGHPVPQDGQWRRKDESRDFYRQRQHPMQDTKPRH